MSKCVVVAKTILRRTFTAINEEKQNINYLTMHIKKPLKIAGYSEIN